MVPIDRGIPIPPRTRPTSARYPFQDMQIGDSIYLPGQRVDRRKGEPFHMQKAVRYAYIYGARHGMRFAARNEGDGVRIWRVPLVPVEAADLFD